MNKKIYEIYRTEYVENGTIYFVNEKKKDYDEPSQDEIVKDIKEQMRSIDL